MLAPLILLASIASAAQDIPALPASAIAAADRVPTDRDQALLAEADQVFKQKRDFRDRNNPVIDWKLLLEIPGLKKKTEGWGCGDISWTYNLKAASRRGAVTLLYLQRKTAHAQAVKDDQIAAATAQAAERVSASSATIERTSAERIRTAAVSAAFASDIESLEHILVRNGWATVRSGAVSLTEEPDSDFTYDVRGGRC